MGRRTYAEEAQIQEAILKVLPDDGGEVRWGDLRASALKGKRLSPDTLSRYLSKSVKQGLIERRVDPTVHPPSVTYALTPIGKNWLSVDPIWRRLRSPSTVPTTLEMFKETGGVVQMKLPARAMREATEGALFVDRGHAKIVAKVIERIDIEGLVAKFTNEIQDALYYIEREDRKVTNLRESIECERDALDADVSLLLRFNAKKARSGIDWEESIRMVEEDAERAEGGLRRLKEYLENIQKHPETSRKEVLESFVAQYARPDVEYEDMVNSIIEDWNLGQLPNPPTPEEIMAFVHEWQRLGLVEWQGLVPTGPDWSDFHSKFYNTDIGGMTGWAVLGIKKLGEARRVSILVSKEAPEESPAK